MKPGPTNSTAPSTLIACGLALALAALQVGARAADWNCGVMPNNAGAFIPLYDHTQEEHAANNL